ncbi:MAG: right-handed parallel beta-helix repeat-containing protein [Akkermansiaceae bacterium]|nr:right-handed parallel beta-helix repeat-containing protein [Akkermansiaceae bacterium]
MTLNEARQILGLGPDEDPRPHLREFRIVRERLAEMVRTAPTEVLAERYQQGLLDIDRALAAVREYLEELGLEMPGPQAPPVAVIEEEPEPARRRGRLSVALAVWVVLLLTLGASGWFYLRWQEELRLTQMVTIARLEREGAGHIEQRRWPEAGAAFAEIERLDPASAIIARGRRSIEAGMAEEQLQFGGYWTGQSRAALEAGRWDEAEAAAREVLNWFPKDQDCATLLTEIAAARATAARRAAIDHARDLLGRRQWDAAMAAAREVLAAQSDDPDARSLIEEATAAKQTAAVERARARTLYQQALARDQGQFDQQALDWLREAVLLSPEDSEIAGLYERMASYTRTLRVPRDFPTPAEALAHARDRDRVILNEGSWKGPLVVAAAVEIQGAGPDKTIIECTAQDGCVITLGPAATGSRLTGLTFRHQSQTGEAERYSSALVRGASVDIQDCGFIDACGHGLMVIEGGTARAFRCRFTDNGWNGAAAMGAGAAIEIRDSKAIGNFENGIEAWNGAELTAINNRCEKNSRNGIHADTGEAAAAVEGNQLQANREFGLVLSAAATGQIRDNTASGNLLGGMVIRSASRIPVTDNQLTRNQGPGLTLEQGLDPAAYTGNTLSGNSGKQVLTGFKYEVVAAGAKSPVAKDSGAPLR